MAAVLVLEPTYDQLAITPGTLVNRRLKYDVFDFYNATFASKWNQLSQQLSPKKARRKFNTYVRFHVSDHGLLWMQFKTDCPVQARQHFV